MGMGTKLVEPPYQGYHWDHSKLSSLWGCLYFRGFICTHVNTRDVNGAEQWCPVKGGGCFSKVSFDRDFTV